MNLEIKNKLSKVLLLIALLPVCFHAFSIFRYGVNIPYWDQWCMPPIFEKIAKGHFTFHDLLTQQNEHRPAFAFLFSIALTRIADWDVRYELIFSFFLACIIALCVYRLIRLAVKDVTLASIAFLAVNFLLFSPVQAENWLHGIQISVYLALVSFVGCLVVSASKIHTAVKFLLCAALCTVSTYSFANGMISWLVASAVLAAESREGLNKLWGKCLIMFWIVAFLSNFALYFYDYQKPAWHPSLKEGFIHPVQALHFFLAFLGNSLGAGRDYLATAAGGIFLLVWVAVIVFLFKEYRQDFLNHHVRWMMMGAFAVISGMIITLSRLGLNQSHNTTLRYTSHSLYLAISLIGLLAVAVEKVRDKKSFFFKGAVYLSFAFSVIFTVFMYYPSLKYGVNWMRHERIRRLQGKASLLLSSVVEEKEGLKMLYPVEEPLLSRVKIVNKLGLLHPALIKNPDMRSIQEKTENEISRGNFENISIDPKDGYEVSGWAFLPGRNEPADAVVLTYENREGKDIMFEIILNREQRPDIVKSHQKDVYINAGWRKNLSKDDIPGQAVKLSAWAFDAERGKAYKLEGTHTLPS